MPGELPTPSGVLYRIGRGPDPLAFPPDQFVGSGRFDDPRRPAGYRVLYIGERRACFYEQLVRFRVDLDGVASQGITAEWLASRLIASARIRDPQNSGRWLDLTSPQTYAQFRTLFAAELRQVKLSDFDVSAATSEMRALTQTISLWAYQAGYRGIRYITRHAPELHCWAVFEGTELEVIDTGIPITLEDVDLKGVAEDWDLPLPMN